MISSLLSAALSEREDVCVFVTTFNVPITTNKKCSNKFNEDNLHSSLPTRRIKAALSFTCGLSVVTNLSTLRRRIERQILSYRDVQRFNETSLRDTSYD